MTPARHAIAWVGLFVINALGITPWALTNYPLADLAEAIYQVRRLELGYAPYRDTFTHHFLGYVLPFHALGSVVTLTPMVLKATALCFNFATAVLVWLIVREVSRPQIAWLGAVLTVTVGWFWGWQGFGFNVQSCLTPMIAVVLLTVVRSCIRSRPSSLYMASFSCGVLLICDQRALAFFALLIVPPFFVPELRRWKVVCSSAIALAFAPACAAWYLWRFGAWSDFLEQTLIFPLVYRNHDVPFAIARWLAAGLGTWFTGELIAVPLMLLGLVLAFFFEARRSIRAVWLTAVMSAATYAVLGGRAYSNYFMVFAPVAVVLISLVPHYIGHRWAVAGRVSIGALMVFGAFCGLRPLLLLSETGSPFLKANEGTVDAVVEYLRVHTSPQDDVLVWGFAPQIYVLSDRFRTFRDASLLSIAGANFEVGPGDDLRSIPHMVREFDDYLAARPPKVIVVYGLTNDSCPGKGQIQRNLDYQRIASFSTLRDLIASTYRSEMVLEGVCDRAEVLVRRDPPTRVSR